MINLPDNYRVGAQGKVLNKKIFFTDALSTAERRRLRDCLGKVLLTHQIAGEEIPSLVNSHYNCAVLLCIDIQLSNLRHKDFVAKIIQPLMKPLAVFRLHDASGAESLSFAHKRLSLNDPESITIESAYCGIAQSDLQRYALLRFTRLVNRNNKRDLYLEAMTKAFLLDHPKLFIGAPELLDTKLWYDGSRILELYPKLTAIQRLKKEKESCKSLAAKADINKRLKVAIQAAKAFLTA